MRSADEKQIAMFSCATLEQQARQDHPLRAILAMAERVLARSDADLLQNDFPGSDSPFMRLP